MMATIEISNDLAMRAMAYAEKEETTPGALVERGLRQVLRPDRERRRFELRAISRFHGTSRLVVLRGFPLARE